MIREIANRLLKDDRILRQDTYLSKDNSWISHCAFLLSEARRSLLVLDAKGVSVNIEEAFLLQ